MTTPKWDIPISVKITRSPVDDPDASVISGMFGLSDRCIETLYDDFRLSISPGEIISLVGPSGGGKTSLLRAVAEVVPDAITLDLDALSSESRPAIACLARSPAIRMTGDFVSLRPGRREDADYSGKAPFGRAVISSGACVGGVEGVRIGRAEITSD